MNLRAGGAARLRSSAAPSAAEEIKHRCGCSDPVAAAAAFDRQNSEQCELAEQIDYESITVAEGSVPVGGKCNAKLVPGGLGAS